VLAAGLCCYAAALLVGERGPNAWLGQELPISGVPTPDNFSLSDLDVQGQPVERSARWHALATGLLDDGAPAGVMAAIGGAVQAEPPGPAVLAAFAAADGPVTLFRVPYLDQPDAAGAGPLPRVLPLLGWLQDHPPHVVVVTDRTGADIEAVTVGGRSRSWSVVGADDEIERNAPGGWAQGRYHHRAEDSWAHNAARVAEAVTTAVHGIHVRLVVAAGDVRAVQLLEEHLPDGLRKQIAWRHTSPVAAARTGHKALGPSASRRRCGRSWTRRSSHCSAASPRSARLGDRRGGRAADLRCPGAGRRGSAAAGARCA
jgi:hypothetical protein